MNMKKILVALTIPALLVLLFYPTLVRRQAGRQQPADSNNQQMAPDVQRALNTLPRAKVASLGMDGAPTFIEGELGRIAIGTSGVTEENLRGVLNPIWLKKLGPILFNVYAISL